MTERETRLQAAVVRGNEILVLQLSIDDGRQFWLLPGGGREAVDADDSAAIAREVREETGTTVVVERVLLEAPAHPDDTRYRQYRTFLCRADPVVSPVAGARDGIASVHQVRWLRLDDENTWGAEILADRFLAPQLRSLRASLAEVVAEESSSRVPHSSGSPRQLSDDRRA